jgi:hypothetical protein
MRELTKIKIHIVMSPCIKKWIITKKTKRLERAFSLPL